MTKPPARIQFDLLTNARDSLQQAVEVFTCDVNVSEHTKLKRAILNSAHCVELLLKEKLHRIHPAFVWEKVDQYPNLEARTVTMETAVGRLKSIGGVSFDANDERSLKSLRKTRNAIEHYEWHTTETEARIIIGTALSFAFVFADRELHTDLAAEFKRHDTWRDLIDELASFHLHYMQKVESMLRDQLTVECHECGAATVTQDGSCQVCGHWQDFET